MSAIFGPLASSRCGSANQVESEQNILPSKRQPNQGSTVRNRCSDRVLKPRDITKLGVDGQTGHGYTPVNRAFFRVQTAKRFKAVSSG